MDGERNETCPRRLYSASAGWAAFHTSHTKDDDDGGGGGGGGGGGDDDNEARSLSKQLRILLYPFSHVTSYRLVSILPHSEFCLRPLSVSKERQITANYLEN